jgi:acyl-ACP thioesterase
MASVPGATELLVLPAVGRRFHSTRMVRLGDVDPGARLRLDATARYLQDIASDDATDAGLDGAWGWVVRRTMIDVGRAAVLDEVVDVTTYCTGTGRSWAERTTVLTGSRGADIRTVSVWVQVAIATGRPSVLTEQFREIYGGACGERTVSARLGLPGPTGETDVRPWAVRRTDLDPFDHVNNAANWAFLEEVVAESTTDRVGRAEMEFLAPVDLDAPVELHVDHNAAPSCVAWLVAAGSVRSAARWTPAR